MKWRGGRRSTNVQNHTGHGGQAGKVAGGGIAALIIAGVGWLFLGGEPEETKPSGPDAPAGVEAPTKIAAPGPASSSAPTGAKDPAKTAPDSVVTSYQENPVEFAEVTVAYTEDVWSEIFSEGAFESMGKSSYTAPTVVLYEKTFKTKCGDAKLSFGPFYCPLDQTVYIDPSFYKELATTYGAPGDFAAAYVIAHEVSHHVQYISGQLGRIYTQQLKATKEEARQLGVRVELQADCYAGLWARKAQETAGILEKGDIEEALRAAHRVGDDMIQRMGGQKVDKTKFTHGSSEQRMRWFKKGYDSGKVDACDTFKPNYAAL
ncbi:MAG: neutral zinc metallopeptidase [Neomegalonema sp.]|nr:neutral zinc metallopeptidase [Neomegalonema sp.]